MPSLLDIKNAVAKVQKNHSILIYGPPKSGKTRLVGTAAKLPEIENIYWIDMENGSETLLHMGLTDAELAKIKLINLTNTRQDPVAIETMLRLCAAKAPLNICDRHGRVDCPACKADKSPFQSFWFGQATHRDLVVIDSGSELGDSAAAATVRGKPTTHKLTFDEWGMVGKWLGDILSVIQAGQNTNFVVITHEISLEGDDGKERFYPLIGSKNFSMKCAKYFGTVIYTHIKLNKHIAGSSSTYKGDTVTGSRVNATIESAAEPDMRTILIEGGVIAPLDKK
jgi:hypothetical protein